jgi:hypothetical protein
MVEMLLDRVGDAQLPTGYRVVRSEVEFLQHATGAQPLLVRGNSLSDWAEVFFQARGVPYREAPSPNRELQAFCPDMTAEAVQAMLTQMGDTFFALPRPLAPTRLLHELYPHRLWHEEHPTTKHAAEWLLWLYEANPRPWLQPLLKSLSARWQEVAPDAFGLVYSAADSETALHLLDAWLRLHVDPRCGALGEFPLPIPATLQNRAREIWRERATATKGDFFEQVRSQPIPFVLKQLAAREASRFYLHQPQQMSQKRLNQLAEYLSSAELQELRKRLAPPAPAPLPDQPKDVLRWFADSYLPYRLWQSANAIVEAGEQVDAAAQSFARWYLARYPQALMGQAMRDVLSFTQAIDCASANTVTLLIVLDGLHAGDARQLQQKVRAHALRLTLIADRLVFAPLPTVTEFCKPALFCGVPPVRAQFAKPLGVILAEDVAPIDELQNAMPGQLYIWRVQEPDRTYHKHNGSGTLLRDVEAQLDAVANKIVDLVDQVPSDISLQIIIATDHGRLLGKSTRRIAVPPGMVSHGRAAWGDSDRSFDASGYAVEKETVYLHGVRFGLPQNAAVVLGQDTFRANDGKGGIEVYPHGGLFPEEVIVPWIVFARDVEAPRLAVSILGDGTAGKRGQLALHVSNLSDVLVTLQEVQLYFPIRGTLIVPHIAALAPRVSEQYQLDFEPWPTADDARQTRARVRVRLPNGLAFEIEAQAIIRSQDMYDRGENILEGLDL